MAVSKYLRELASSINQTNQCRIIVTNLLRPLKAKPDKVYVFIDISREFSPEERKQVESTYVCSEINSKILDILIRDRCTEAQVSYFAEYMNLSYEQAADRLNESEKEDPYLEKIRSTLKNELAMWDIVNAMNKRDDYLTNLYETNKYAAYHPWMTKGGKIFGGKINKTYARLSPLLIKKHDKSALAFYFWLAMLDDRFIGPYSVDREGMLEGAKHIIEISDITNAVSHRIVLFLINMQDDDAWDKYIKPCTHSRLTADEWVNFIMYLKRVDYCKEKIVDLILTLVSNKLELIKKGSTSINNRYPTILSSFLKEQDSSNYYVKILKRMLDEFMRDSKHTTKKLSDPTIILSESFVRIEKELINISD